jgi:hypothetical protein
VCKIDELTDSFSFLRRSTSPNEQVCKFVRSHRFFFRSLRLTTSTSRVCTTILTIRPYRRATGAGNVSETQHGCHQAGGPRPRDGGAGSPLWSNSRPLHCVIQLVWSWNGTHAWIRALCHPSVRPSALARHRWGRRIACQFCVYCILRRGC